MAFISKHSRLRQDLGQHAVDFVEYCLGAVERLLPHLEVAPWKVRLHQAATSATWTGAGRRQIRLVLGGAIKVQRKPLLHFAIATTVVRRKAPAGVGHVSRTLAAHEKDICNCILEILARVFQGVHSGAHPDSFRAIEASFDERIVARYLEKKYDLRIDLAEVFRELRGLAERSYENKALSFGCVVTSSRKRPGNRESSFPAGLSFSKRHCALSDGFQTAFVVSKRGAIIKLADMTELPGALSHTHSLSPDWCATLAKCCTAKSWGVALTRAGELIVCENGALRFTYRFGQWKYWNHAHLIDVLHGAARVQRVAPNRLRPVIRAMYRTALDVSFRRTGGMLVLLRSQGSLRHFVRDGDAIGDVARHGFDASLDASLQGRAIDKLARAVRAELVGLDGAVVVGNDGYLLAYGAVVSPRRRGRHRREEGARTKAAIGASQYGLTIKISADGEIRAMRDGDTLWRI